MKYLVLKGYKDLKAHSVKVIECELAKRLVEKGIVVAMPENKAVKIELKKGK